MMDWTAHNRICNILSRRTLASLQQLVCKVCECGPARPDPSALNEVVNRMVEAELVKVETGPCAESFLYLVQTPQLALDSRRKGLYPVMKTWSVFGKDETHLASLVLECIDKQLSTAKVHPQKIRVRSDPFQNLEISPSSP